MKMKEVCALTGLTERTIRFYAEKGLVTPKTHRQNGREYSEYSAEDVDALRTTAVLRKMLFSIEEISRMRARPNEIPSVIHEYRERITEEAEVRAEILALDESSLTGCKSIAELARMMSAPASRRRLPEGDVSPDFARFEPDAPEDKQAAYQHFLENQEIMERRGFIIIAVIAAVNVLSSIVSLILGNGNILALILNIVFSIALLAGQSWARVLFFISLILSAGINLYVFFVGLVSGLPPFTLVLCAICAVFSAAGAVLLLCSKSVREYMYHQKNG